MSETTEAPTPATARERAMCRAAVLNTLQNKVLWSGDDASFAKALYPDPPRTLRVVTWKAEPYSYEARYKDGWYDVSWSFNSRAVGGVKNTTLARVLHYVVLDSDATLRALMALTDDPYEPEPVEAGGRHVGTAVSVNGHLNIVSQVSPIAGGTYELLLGAKVGS